MSQIPCTPNPTLKYVERDGFGIPRQASFEYNQEKEGQCVKDTFTFLPTYRAKEIIKMRPRQTGIGYTEGKRYIGKPSNQPLIVRIGHPPTRFTQSTALEVWNTEILSWIESALLQTDLALNIVPDIAEAFEVDATGTQYTFKLRGDAKWSNGIQMTAEDLIFTYDVMMEPKSSFMFRQNFFVDDGNRGKQPIKIEKVDTRTVRFILPKPNGAFLFLMTQFFPLPSHDPRFQAALKNKENFGTLENIKLETLATSGPYRVVKSDLNEIVLEANPYFGKKDEQGQPLPYIRYVILKVQEELAAKHSLEVGAMHLLNEATPSQLRFFQENPEKGAILAAGGSAQWSALVFNQSDNMTPPHLRELFQNLKFRQAVAHAVNKDSMPPVVFQGYGEVAQCPSLPGFAGHYACGPLEYDPDKAARLFSELGLKDTDGDGILEYKGEKVKITLLSPAEDHDIRGRLAQIIEQNLKQVGIKVNLDSPDKARMYANIHSRNYQAAMISWTDDPDPALNIALWHPSGESHYWKAKAKPEECLDWEKQSVALLETVTSNPAQATRFAAMREVYRLAHENQAFLPLVSQGTYSIAAHHLCNTSIRIYAPIVFSEVEYLYFADDYGHCELTALQIADHQPIAPSK